eukprot:scaffold1057_cov194-Skeletonema_menzelii.AAC.2
MESDWSSRRKSAMNRARELRSKIKEMHSENGDDTSNAIMTSREIQRQRRSRQLEETQRLLDQFADAGVVDEQKQVSSNDSVRSGNVSMYGNYGSIEAQVASSQELLGRTHRRDKYPAADPIGDYAVSETRQLVDYASSRIAERQTVQETSHRQPGQFGRGRGRGRSGSNSATATSSRQVGSSLQSSNPFPRDYNTMDKPDQKGQERNNESTAKSQCFYLRDHRVPEHKEGECDKLVVLRQRLAARRRRRELALEGKTKENDEPSSLLSMEKPRSHHVDNEAVPHQLSSRQQMNQFSHKDVDDSNRSYRSSRNNNANQLNESTGSGGSIVSEKSVVDIELIQCDCCGRSFAPKVYEKHFDSSGQPKCANDKKRPVFNSAKARIANNSNLNQDEQRQVLQMNKRVTKDLAKKKNGKGRTIEKIRRSSKWRDESRAFRDAMKACRL